MNFREYKIERQIRSGFGLLVFSLAFITAAVGRPAYAQMGGPTIEAPGPLLTAIVGDSIDRSVTDVLVETSVIALTNALNYFTSQIAYQAALAITSDCPGQKNCWSSKAWRQNLRDASLGAAGEAIGSISEGLLGGDFLCSPSIQFELKIQLGLMDDLKPEEPKCNFNDIVNNWKSFSNSLETGEVLEQFIPVFEPGQTPIGFSLDVMDGLIEEQEKAEQEQVLKFLGDAAAGGGFGPIADAVSGRIKSPQAVVEKEFDTAYKNREENPTKYSQATSAAAIARGAVGSIFTNMAMTFSQTLIARLWNKLVNGLLPSEELMALQPDLILDSEGALVQGRSGQQKALQSRYLYASPRNVAIYDPLIEFSSCPGSDVGPNHCVIDGQFASAVRIGDTFPISVQEAIDKKMLNADWPLIPASAREKDLDPFCHTYGYCESNLKKLRAARIIPIGWELAAAKSNPTAFATLGQVVAGFNDCNADEEADSQHPWCHMIDPKWVLKLPPTMCRAEVNGPTLKSPEASVRGELCVDAPTCLRQDDYGACVGGWGYCMRERNAWRFNGDQCPAEFNSCLALSARDGEQVALLMNTVQPGICNAGNVGCMNYALDRNLEESLTNPSDDWLTSSYRYLNREAKVCNPSHNGCTAVVPLKQGESLNLIRNGSFELLDDGDGDGAPEHPKYWSPYGSVSAGPGSMSIDGSKSTHGIIAMHARLQDSIVDGLTIDRAPDNVCNGSVCNEADGCPCEKTIGTGSNQRKLTCRIKSGLNYCQVTDAVAQSGIPVRRGATYTLSFSAVPATNTNTVNAFAYLKFFDSERAPVNVYGKVASTVAFSGGVVDGDDIACQVYDVRSDQLAFEIVNGSKDAASKDMRFSCTFSVNANVTLAEVIFYGSDAGMYIDAVQLEEGPLTPFHEGYGTASSVEYRRIAPDYLSCTGEENDPAKCADFTQYCRESEVGCASYAPTNGDPSIPAIVSQQDLCPAECSGYDVFKQEVTDFDKEKFPLYFIPRTATACSVNESGCSEFTDIETEAVSYYSKLRLCEKPTTDPDARFYTWEGSDDTDGFQLRNWALKPTVDVTDVSAQYDLAAATGATTAGYAPCTALKTDGITCNSRDSSGNSSTFGFCTRADIDAGNLDCREFYDQFGNRHFRLMSRTIILSDSCRLYRITTSTFDDCTGSNGRWDDDRKQCIYSADLNESSACDAKANGCRPYKGNAADNVRTVLFEQFENGSEQALWSGGDITNDSVVSGGHSYRFSGNDTLSAKIETLVAPGRSYSLSFWAHGSGSLTVNIDGSEDLDFPTSIDLPTNWRRFEIGPVSSDDLDFGETSTKLNFVRVGSNNAFLDNVVLREVQDSIFVVRDSWVTPLSCDTAVGDAIRPQEMLGCKEYLDMNSKQTYLRSFSQLCREKAVGCSAYSDTRNSLENPYAETYNAVCDLGATCTSLGAQSGTCRCDYTESLGEYGLYATRTAATREHFDVCRVPLGERSCRFHLDGYDDYGDQSDYLDRVRVEADERMYIVPDAQFACPSQAVGCREVGLRKEAFDQECILQTACDAPGGCSCPVNDGSCVVEQGKKNCTVIFETPIIASWESPTILDFPDMYDRSLCTVEAIRCEEFKSGQGVHYFKHPRSMTCEFKEDVVEQGIMRSGWFRVSESGINEPCSPELLKNGEFFDIARNADESCQLLDSDGNPDKCDSSAGCWCKKAGVDVCRVAKGRTMCGYNGWVGLCAAEFDRCEEFIDPAKTSPANPKGEPYYYLMNDKVDMKSCGGTASLKDGCVMFQRTGDTSRTMASTPTYFKSDEDAGGNGVTPIDCNRNPRHEYCNGRCVRAENAICLDKDDRTKGSRKTCYGNGQCTGNETCVGDRIYYNSCTSDADCLLSGDWCNELDIDDWQSQNDANVVIKVRPDRECAQWLACSATDLLWDEGVGQWKNVCTQMDACEQQRAVGDSQECSKWSDVSRSKLTDVAYSKRDVTYGGREYTGYSIPQKYPIQFVGLAKPSSKLKKKLYGVVTDTSDSCNSSSDCGTGGVCYGEQCFFDLSGGPLTDQDSIDTAACRGYPEPDAPFETTVVERNGSVETIKSGFRGANICAIGSVCDCNYQRVGYGNGGVNERFVSFENPQYDYDKICVGGPRNGMECTDDPTDCVSDEGGTCMTQSKRTSVLGWEGYCVDPDYSYNIGGDSSRYGCNLWLPVDRLPGSPDLDNQELSAGFQPSGDDYVYCAVAEGKKNYSIPEPISSNSGSSDYLSRIVSNETSYEISSLPIYNLTNLLSSSITRSAEGTGCAGSAYGAAGTDEDGVMRLKWCPMDDGRNQCIRVEPPSTVRRSDVSYVIVKMFAGTDVDSTDIDSGDYDGRKPLFLLYEGNNWVAEVEWTDNDGGCEAHGERVPCSGIYAQAKGTAQRNNRAQMKLSWNADGTLNYFNVYGKMDDEDDTGSPDDTGSVCGPNSPKLYIYAFAVLREQCTEVKTVSDKESQGMSAVAWTNRIWKSGYSSKGEGYDFGHISKFAGREDVDQTPFGRIVQEVDVDRGDNVKFEADSDSNVNWPLHVWTTEAGSAGAMRIKCEVDGDTKYDNDCYCHQKDSGGENDCTITFDGGGTTSGIPYACKGDCPYSGSNGVPGLNDGWDGAGDDASADAAVNLSNLFARIYGTYRWSGEGGTYDYVSDDTTGATDFRAANTNGSSVALGGYAPTVRAVNTQACVGKQGNCPEGPEGLTVNNFMSGDLTAAGGRYNAVIKFYAWAHEDHMPIRKRYIDFGDGTPPDQTSGNASYYKNRRGCKTLPDGSCDGGAEVCAASEDDAENWGLRPESCETGYFTINRVYRCTNALLSTLPSCSPASGYPCKRSVAVGGENKLACVYKPRVRVVDNWGQCNGDCPGGQDNSGACINKRDDFDFDDTDGDLGNGECKDLESGAWTNFAGEIRVAP